MVRVCATTVPLREKLNTAPTTGAAHESPARHTGMVGPRTTVPCTPEGSRTSAAKSAPSIVRLVDREHAVPLAAARLRDHVERVRPGVHRIAESGESRELDRDDARADHVAPRSGL